MTPREWLTQHLISGGYLDENRIGRRLQLRLHPPCGQRCGVALDGNVAALTRWVDIARLDYEAEVEAWGCGHATFELWSDRTITSRYWAWSTWPTTRPVLVEHHCEEKSR